MERRIKLCGYKQRLLQDLLITTTECIRSRFWYFGALLVITLAACQTTLRRLAWRARLYDGTMARFEIGRLS
jgi:hypothetical protein